MLIVGRRWKWIVAVLVWTVLAGTVTAADENDTSIIQPTSTEPTLTETSIQWYKDKDQYWTVTVIRVYPSVDVNSKSWQVMMEERVTSLMWRTYEVRMEKAKGTFTPLLTQRRKRDVRDLLNDVMEELRLSRRKRETTQDFVTVELTNVTRVESSSQVELVYAVYNNETGDLVTTDEVRSLLNELTVQEVALLLGYYYDGSDSYECFYNPATCTTANTGNNLWIIAAVLVPIVLLVLIIWCILFIYFKCCTVPRPPTPRAAKMPELGVIVDGNEKGTMAPGSSLTELRLESDLYQPNRNHGNSIVDKLANGTVHHEEEIVAAKSAAREESSAPRVWSRRGSKVEPLEPVHDFMPQTEELQLFPPITDRERAILQARANVEHEKNLERLRRRYIENEELNKVLGDPTYIPPVFKNKKRSRKHPKRSKLDSGHTNPGYSDGEKILTSETEPESDTASGQRRKINKMLDSAFSMISPKERKRKRQKKAQQPEPVEQPAAAAAPVFSEPGIIDVVEDDGVWMALSPDKRDAMFPDEALRESVRRQDKPPYDSPLSKSAPLPYAPREGGDLRPHRTVHVAPSGGTLRPQRSFDPDFDDEMDVIRSSLRPGESPDPLIKSIREELKRYNEIDPDFRSKHRRESLA